MCVSLVYHITALPSLAQSKIANEIAATSGVFQPSQIAKDILDGVQVSVFTLISVVVVLVLFLLILSQGKV